jgi:hypothetical protein
MTTNNRRTVLKGAAAIAGASMIGRAKSGRPRIRVAAWRGVPFGTGEALLNDLSYRKRILWI